MVTETSPDFASRCIMKVIGAPYSHACIIYDDLVYHCIGRGVCVQNLKEGLHNSFICGEKEVELKCDESTFLAFIEGARGKDYSESQLIGFLMPKWFRRYFTDGRSEIICSEFVAWVLVTFTDIKFKQDIDFITPKELFEAIP